MSESWLVCVFNNLLSDQDKRDLKQTQTKFNNLHTMQYKIQTQSPRPFDLGEMNKQTGSTFVHGFVKEVSG